MRVQRGERAFLVGAHQGAVANDIAGEDGGEFARRRSSFQQARLAQAFELVLKSSTLAARRTGADKQVERLELHRTLRVALASSVRPSCP